MLHSLTEIQKYYSENCQTFFTFLDLFTDQASTPKLKKQVSRGIHDETYLVAALASFLIKDQGQSKASIRYGCG